MKRSRKRSELPPEDRLVEHLARSFGSACAHEGVLVGIGDDAAVLRHGKGRLVWTIDTSVEGVHFERRWLSLAEVGARSFHAAVSDVAAMGARPIAALSNVAVPAALGERAIRAIASGQTRASRELACPVVGGNSCRAREISVTTTVLGEVAKALTRDGARAGDDIWLHGDVGLAAAGLLCLREPARVAEMGRASRRAVAACIHAWRRPQALLAEGRALRGRAHALIDVSDGLATDAARIGRASDVRIVLEETLIRAVLRPELIAVSDLLGVDALTLALAGGEDYALIATGRTKPLAGFARRIGRIEKGRGLRLEMSGGRTRPVPRGFDHFD